MNPLHCLNAIESLRDRKTPDEIETMLLGGEFGEIRTHANSYQYINSLAVSYLIVEIHEPGFIIRMRQHPQEYVVHHKDGNPSNNIYSNLRMMKGGGKKDERMDLCVSYFISHGFYCRLLFSRNPC